MLTRHGHVVPEPRKRLRSSSLRFEDRKSTRLNSSHLVISYAVFCLKKKTTSLNPYFDNIQFYVIGRDQDHDGVRDSKDACPAVSAAGQDARGAGFIEPTATLRHVA